MAGVVLRRRPAALIGIGIVVWMGWLGVHLLLANADLRAGMRAVDKVKDESELAEIAEGAPLPDLRRAEFRFRRANRRLTGPTWAPARVLPVVGRQLRSVAALSGAAGDVTRAGIHGVSGVQRRLEGPPPRGRARVAVIRGLAGLADDVDHELSTVRMGPRKGLVAPLARRRNQLAEEVAEVRTGLIRGSSAGRAAADLLAGPRRYLVLAANNSEMRAGAGMFLSAGELVARDGELRLGEMKTVTEIEIPPGSVSLSGDLADRWGWLRPNDDWRNLMLSPRFDLSAPLAAQMWVASGHEPVDGVLALDLVMLQAMLDATGPVVVEDRTIDAQNVIDELTYTQYLLFPTNEERPERRERLGALARSTFDALETGNPSLSAMAGGMARAARGRHIFAWSSKPSEQAGWMAAGVDGSLTEDSLLVSLINRSGTKMDPFLDVSADLDLEPAGKDVGATLRVDVHSRVPAIEASNITGPHPGSGVEEGEYLGILAVSLPSFSRQSRFEGVSQLAVAGQDGPTRVVGSQFRLRRGESKTLVLTFLLPSNAPGLTVRPSARVPGIAWTSSGQSWPDTGSHRVVGRTSGGRVSR